MFRFSMRRSLSADFTFKLGSELVRRSSASSRQGGGGGAKTARRLFVSCGRTGCGCRTGVDSTFGFEFLSFWRMQFFSFNLTWLLMLAELADLGRVVLRLE
ncbi:hypothetical protein BpHYR1_046864 [Brachionus plicatilis]|uniref:Uncharacterized protein n=1 Tax=Brachionus plicatilis TaxID=10195 RepID=A0A3M7RFU3_BRAPC|nr:hypothetical protein BpHYR1_046864 [Brachionus plicatilis]